MIDFFNFLSNREISILIWSFIIFSVLISSSNSNFGNLVDIIKALFSKKFIPFYIVFALYFSTIIFTLIRLSVWESFLYKDFTYWFVTTGIVLFFRANRLKTKKDFIKVIVTATSLTIILEFIIGFYNFNLILELILIPIATFISMLAYFAERKKDDPNTKIVAKILKRTLSTIGFIIFLYCIYQLIIDYANFFTLRNLKSFLLPPIFTLLFLPFIYFTVLYIKYERVFLNLKRYRFLSENRKKKIRISILKYANVNFKYVENANKILVFKKRELQAEIDICSYLRKNIKQGINT